MVAVVGGLVVIAVAKFATVSGPQVRRRYLRSRQRRITKRADREAARKQAEQQRARTERIAAADIEGSLVAVNHTGRRPVRVTFNDGTVSYYFCGDWQAYQAAMQSGRCDPRRTFPSNPPPLV